jgi:hypothetical protein
MKYDDASWHYGGDFPDDLPEEAAATHIGMFLAWAITNDLAGELHLGDSQDSIQKVKNRSMTGREFLLKECDEKFTDEDLNEEGNLFAQYYYEGEDDHYGKYLADYEETLLSGLPSMYHVDDTWENFDKIESPISKSYQEWKATG